MCSIFLEDHVQKWDDYLQKQTTMSFLDSEIVNYGVSSQNYNRETGFLVTVVQAVTVVPHYYW